LQHIYLTKHHKETKVISKMRSKIVSRENTWMNRKDLNLIRFIDSKVPIQHFGENIHGNIFESLIGAIYLDRGYLYCENLFRKSHYSYGYFSVEGKVISYKSLVIEWCQKKKISLWYLRRQWNRWNPFLWVN
jgi:ribonuclease-3